MDNLMDLIFGIVYNDHDSDLIGRDQVDDYTIDTCLTADQGYETAVWVGDHNMVIVARYATREEAVLGHYEWLIDVKVILGLPIAFSLSAMFYSNIRSLL